MDDQAIRTVLFEVLGGIAPEVDPADIDPAALLRDQVDLDSMDWLNFLIGLHERLAVDIPEADYAGLDSVEHLVAYLRAKLGG